jgi:hypothetical protein
VSSRANLAYARQRAKKRFGNEPCADCGQTDELALQEFADRGLCRKCTLLAQNLAPTEIDHSFGRRNSRKTQAMDANDHALLTALQGYWPRATQQNEGRSQQVTVVAGLRRQVDLLALERERIGREIRWLEHKREHIDQVVPEIESLIRSLEEPDAESDATRKRPKRSAARTDPHARL